MHLLESIGAIRIPETALEELERGSTDISALAFTAVEVEYDDSAYPHLDPGETAAIVLCSDQDAVLLTDDLDARNTAQDVGIEVHGSVGVIVYAYSHDELSEEEAKRVLRALKQETNLYLAGPLVEHAIGVVESDEAGW